MTKFHDTLKKLHEAATPKDLSYLGPGLVNIRTEINRQHLGAVLLNSVPALLRLLETAKEALATYPEGHMHERAWVVAFEEYDRLDELERALEALDELDEEV